MAMGMAYVGVGLLARRLSLSVKPLTEDFGFRRALLVLGSLMFLAWPVAILVLRNRPSDMGLHPDGDAAAPVGTVGCAFELSAFC